MLSINPQPQAKAPAFGSLIGKTLAKEVAERFTQSGETSDIPKIISSMNDDDKFEFLAKDLPEAIDEKMGTNLFNPETLKGYFEFKAIRDWAIEQAQKNNKN